jgi:preprotein translocase subunit SecD
MQKKSRRNMKTKLTWKIWLWIIVLIFSLVSIFITPNFMQKGVVVTSIGQNSSAFEQGLRAGDIITAIDGKTIASVEDFTKAMEAKVYTEKVKTTITTTKSEFVTYSNSSLQITVSKLPLTNLKLGLDLAGGARALVKANNHTLTSSEATDLVSIMSNRFNVYGLTDMKISTVRDLAGNNFISVEIAGATQKEVQDLISQQGKFEAKIGNDTVFRGEKKDITNVARGGQESGVYDCQQASDGYYCTFRFNIYLSPEAAERQAAITNTLDVNSSASSKEYLSKTLDLYVDGKLMDSLQIGAELKGRAETIITISGTGTGATQNDAITSAQGNMKNLQTILITGSLPFELEIVKLDTISPTLGNDFARYILIAGLISIVLVSLIVLLRYRVKAAMAPLAVCISEIIITLGIASLINWNLDLPSIAGILAAIGTGVDDQIVILDESRHKEESLNIKQKIKRAFVIVLGAYVTMVASLIPLFWAGAGLLTGFALTTLIGISIGVFITRPAFADMIKLLDKENAS